MDALAHAAEQVRAREAGGSYRPGDVVFETIDGGGLPGRVVATMADAAEVLVRLDPALSPLPGLRTHDREAYRHRGYLVFAASSLSPLHPAAPVQPHAEAEPARGNGDSAMRIDPKPPMHSVNLTAAGDAPGVLVSDFGDCPIPPAIGEVMGRLSLWEEQALARIKDGFLAGERARDIALSDTLPELPAPVATAVPVTEA